MATTTAAPVATGHHTGHTGTTGEYPIGTGTGTGTGAGYGHHNGYDGEKGGRPGLFRRDSQPGFPDYGDRDRRRIANPAPLGMYALAATTLFWSLINARTRNLYEVNAVVGMALLVGGLCTLLAGMWEFVHGNTFAATAFTLLAGFWGSYGLMYWPSSGALSAYDSTSDLGSVLGIYFMVWMVVALHLFLATFRGSVPLASTFFLLFLTFMLIGIAHFTGRTGVLRAGGVIGCLAAVLAFYTGSLGFHNRHTTYYNLPAASLTGRKKNNDAANARY